MTPGERELLKAVFIAAKAQAESIFLVGALANRVITQRDQLASARATKDADLGVRLNDWGEFARLKSSLESKGFRHAQLEYRLESRVGSVDLIPLGAHIESPQGVITWPEARRQFNVIGFEEAWTTLEQSEVESGLSVRHPSIPGLVLLKLMAFMDRNESGNTKYKSDAEDVMGWFRFCASENKNSAALPQVAERHIRVDFPFAGVALLGTQVRKIVSDPSHGAVRRFLQDYGGPHSAFASAVVSRDPRYFVASCISAFSAGFNAA